GDDRRNARLADAARRRVALDQVYVGLVRRVIHARHLKVVEVALRDAPVGRRDLAAHREPGGHHRRALELRADAVGVHDDPRIHHLLDARYPYAAASVRFHFDDRRDIRVEAAMGSDAQPPATARLALAPARALTGKLQHTPQPPGVDRVFVERRTVVGILHVLRFQIDDLPGPQQ